mmetsp:Transcript_67051/g.207812  ORF Transcript_67051/g.207812 Transcript_67051/m.207812 type:complete len:210 (+) Transcript_67051:307-936(+)
MKGSDAHSLVRGVDVEAALLLPAMYSLGEAVGPPQPNATSRHVNWLTKPESTCLNCSLSASNVRCFVRHFATSSATSSAFSRCRCSTWLSTCCPLCQSSSTCAANLSSTYWSTASSTATVISLRLTLPGGVAARPTSSAQGHNTPSASPARQCDSKPGGREKEVPKALTGGRASACAIDHLLEAGTPAGWGGASGQRCQASTGAWAREA